MKVYLFLFYIMVIGLFWRKPKYKKWWFYFISSTIILIVGLRSDIIGYDTHNYLDFFMHQTSKDTYYTRESIEPGLSVFFAVIECVWKNQNFATFVTAFASLFPIFFLYKKYSPKPLFSVFLFCSFSIGSAMLLLEMAAMRQCLAIGFYAVGLYLFAINNYRFNKKSILFFLMMLFTHYSSALVILLFVFHFIHFNNKAYYYIICTISCLSGYFIADYIMLIQLFAGMMDKGFYVSNFGETSNNFISLIPYWGTFVFLLFFTSNENINSFWIKGFFLAVCFTGILQTFGMNIERICAYFYITTFIAIPEMIKSMEHNKICKWSFYAVTIGYFTYKYFLNLQIASQLDYGQVPYHSFL